LGMNHKMGHNIAQVVLPKHSLHELIIVGIDNDRARWTHEKGNGKRDVTADASRNASAWQPLTTATTVHTASESPLSFASPDGDRVLRRRFALPTAHAVSPSQLAAWGFPVRNTTAAVNDDDSARRKRATAVCDRGRSHSSFSCNFPVPSRHETYVSFLRSACIWPSTIVRHLWLFQGRSDSSEHAYDIHDELARLLTVVTAGFGEQPHEARSKHSKGAVVTGSKWNVLKYGYYSSSILHSKVSELRGALDSCIQYYNGENVGTELCVCVCVCLFVRGLNLLVAHLSGVYFFRLQYSMMCRRRVSVSKST